EVDYIVAPPRMGHYITYSTRIYEVYLKYVAPEDIHVYSIDEVFIDATDYLKIYNLDAHQLTMKLIREVLTTTGITATAGIGPNLYLCKIAMDIVAKHIPADADGVRIAELTEQSFREKLWDHRPLTDFWRIGHGIASKLERFGLMTMGDVARCSLQNEALLYKLFGVNAELLMDHAWGYESCTMADIKAYRSETNSLSSGQVLTEPYTAAKARVVVREMANQLAYDMTYKRVKADQLVLWVGYDSMSLEDPAISSRYDGEVVRDYYGKLVPKPVNGSIRLPHWTDSGPVMEEYVLRIFDSIVQKDLLIRRIGINANHVLPEEEVESRETGEQLDLFSSGESPEDSESNEDKERRMKDRKRQEAILSIRDRFGSNAVVMGLNLEEGATGILRNAQVGGHKA
ncbi:MAG: DNA methylase, partial [Lachnospiraceae bacterium]|nr:DNA methylase [Lachnospiraceae bacterium]